MKNKAITSSRTRAWVGNIAIAQYVGKKRFTRLRQAFSLVEVILALGLSIVLLGLLSIAMNMILFDLEEDRLEMERARAARAVLDVMAVDLRAAIQFKPQDQSALDEALDAAQSAAASLTGEEEEAEEPEQEEVVVEHPGLLGTSDSLSLDISRLPRRDQFTPTVDPENGNIISFPSEVKNVTYRYGLVTTDGPAKDEKSGLLRLEFDRAAKRFAEDYGGSIPGYEMMSSEVQSIQFRFFDGRTWSDGWDSNEKQTLPVAVEITLKIDPRSASQIRDGVELDETLQYVKIVNLPVAESIQEIEAREEALNFVE